MWEVSKFINKSYRQSLNCSDYGLSAPVSYTAKFLTRFQIQLYFSVRRSVAASMFWKYWRNQSHLVETLVKHWQQTSAESYRSGAHAPHDGYLREILKCILEWRSEWKNLFWKSEKKCDAKKRKKKKKIFPHRSNSIKSHKLLNDELSSEFSLSSFAISARSIAARGMWSSENMHRLWRKKLRVLIAFLTFSSPPCLDLASAKCHMEGHRAGQQWWDRVREHSRSALADTAVICDYCYQISHWEVRQFRRSLHPDSVQYLPNVYRNSSRSLLSNRWDFSKWNTPKDSW